MTRDGRWIGSVTLCLLLAAAAAVPACARAQSTRPFFAPDSFWNASLPWNAPLDARSRELVAELRRQVSGYGSTINTTRYSSPIYTVPWNQPKVRVRLDVTNAPLLAGAFAAVPLPAGARPAAGTDGNLVVWQPATDTMWEFWRLRKEADGWHAAYGGRHSHVMQSPGHYRDLWSATGALYERKFWGATATSLPRAGGLMRIAELEAGVIRHGLAVAIPEARKGVWSLPAQRTDGTVDSPRAIPEGARFRLDPRVDLSKLDLPPFTRMMAEAAQRYGIVVQNEAGAVAFYAEDPRGTDPYPRLFGDRRPYQLMRAFPWQYLQALKLELRP